MSSVSPVVIEDEYKKATETGMLPLIGIALLLIAALVLLFMRTFSDLLLTLGRIPDHLGRGRHYAGPGGRSRRLRGDAWPDKEKLREGTDDP